MGGNASGGTQFEFGPEHQVSSGFPSLSCVEIREYYASRLKWNNSQRLPPHYFVTYLTNSMEHSTWEANSSLAGQERVHLAAGTDKWRARGTT